MTRWRIVCHGNWFSEVFFKAYENSSMPPGIKTTINVRQSCSVVDFETMQGICQLAGRGVGDVGDLYVFGL